MWSKHDASAVQATDQRCLSLSPRISRPLQTVTGYMKQVRRNESDIHVTAKSLQVLVGTTQDICNRDAQLQRRPGDL